MDIWLHPQPWALLNIAEYIAACLFYKYLLYHGNIDFELGLKLKSVDLGLWTAIIEAGHKCMIVVIFFYIIFPVLYQATVWF